MPDQTGPDFGEPKHPLPPGGHAPPPGIGPSLTPPGVFPAAPVLPVSPGASPPAAPVPPVSPSPPAAPVPPVSPAPHAPGTYAPVQDGVAHLGPVVGGTKRNSRKRKLLILGGLASFAALLVAYLVLAGRGGGQVAEEYLQAIQAEDWEKVTELSDPTCWSAEEMSQFRQSFSTVRVLSWDLSLGEVGSHNGHQAATLEGTIDLEEGPARATLLLTIETLRNKSWQVCSVVITPQ